jgi:predicted phosphodiesterase
MAVSDSHGQFVNHDCAQAALAFADEYRPHVRLHLGDWNDQTAFMSKSLANPGGQEACESIDTDARAGIEFVTAYRPHYLFQGNHDHRPYKLLRHPNAIVQQAARTVVADMERFAKSIRAELVPYHGVHDPRAWRLLGGTAFGHGVMHGLSACEQHVWLLRRPCVFGHTHRVDTKSARTLGGLMGRTIGCLADIDKLTYAHANQSTAAWRNAWAFGEYGDNWCTVEVQTWQPASTLAEIPAIN